MGITGILSDGCLAVSLRLMERFAEVRPVRLTNAEAAADPLRLAVAAYLARYTGSSRDHTHSDLRCFLSWCLEHRLDPLAASRVHLELYIRWMQEVRRFKPSTVSRRFLGYCGVLPHRGDRRRAGSFSGRACPSAYSAAGVADTRVHLPGLT
jgi:hypothetical protein